MGVKDFIRLVQKTCPGLMRELPNRLGDLQGKTIVIDGTLLTQRMHFARIPYRNRHVLAWYRLVMDMKEAGVNAICVFDSTKGRPVAKQKEVERRRLRRRLDEARYIMELERLDRLRRMRSRMETLPRSELHKSVSQFGASTSAPEAQGPLDARQTERAETRVESYETVPPTVPTRDDRTPDPVTSSNTETSAESAAHSEPSEQQKWSPMQRFSDPSDQSEEPTRSQSSVPTSDQIIRDPGSPESSTTTMQTDVPSTGNIQRRSWAEPAEPAGPTTPLPETNELRDLFCNFLATKSQFATIKSPPPAPAADDPEEDFEQVQAYSMSRNQYALAEVEEQIWNRLLYASEPFPDEHEDAEDDIQGRLSQLELKSNSMVDMYERRRPPDQETYNDSKLILRAMGIPCLESPIAIEGEAYAAALVRSGRGDYVASEDTDVIIYEAPLLRGLGSKKNALVEVDGAQVRMALDLPRESFVDLALLCGTDFSQRLKHIGPFTALKLIRKFSSIENLLIDPQLSAKLPASDYLDDIAQARLVFASSPPMPDDAELEQGQLDHSEVQGLLEKYGLARLARTRVDEEEILSPGATFDDISSLAFAAGGFGESLEGMGTIDNVITKPEQQFDT